ncbi:MAG: hypothetical protein ACRDBT_06170 [Aeromonas sp.]
MNQINQTTITSKGCCRLGWLGPLLGLLSAPSWAEVQVIAVFEAPAVVQTLKDLYPELGVSAMGNQLVLSGTPVQLQEAQRTLAKINVPPQSVLIEWRVDEANRTQQRDVAIRRDEAKGQWQLDGAAQQFEGSHNDHWQVSGLSGRPVLLQMGSYQPITFYQWHGGAVVGMIPLTHGLYATATLIGDQVQIALSSEQERQDQGQISTRQSRTELSGAVGQWLTVGALSSQFADDQGLLGTQLQGRQARQHEQQTLQIRVSRP